MAKPIPTPRSLSLQLIRTITLALIGTLILGGTLIYWHAVQRIEAEMRAAIVVGSRIAHNALDDVDEISATRRRLELTVADFDDDRHLRASLRDQNNVVIRQSILQPPSATVPRWIYQLLAGESKIVRLELPEAFNKFGTVVLETDSHNEVAEVWSDAKLYLLILAAFCGVVLLILWIALGRALRPLNDLTGAFAEIGAGRYDRRVNIGGPRELVELGSGFNSMSERLVEMERRNRRLREQLETVQEEERAELARALHDEMSPLLLSVDVDATALRQHGETSRDPDVEKRAAAILDAVLKMKRNVKGILGQLRPSGLHALGLANSIENLVAFWKKRHPGIAFSVNVPPRSFGVRMDAAIQNIVREGIANAIRHAKPRRIDISLDIEPGNLLSVEIIDDGVGLAPTLTSGYGIIGMQERAALLGGTLEVIDRKDQRGVRVKAILPVDGTWDLSDSKSMEAGTRV